MKRLVPTYNVGNVRDGQRHLPVDPRHAKHPTCPDKRCMCECETCKR